ncbi:MAG: hypothetical protein ACYSUI_16855 [Planctomycetota bacterium]|jgi:hypothetical protein
MHRYIRSPAFPTAVLVCLAVLVLSWGCQAGWFGTDGHGRGGADDRPGGAEEAEAGGFLGGEVQGEDACGPTAQACAVDADCGGYLVCVDGCCADYRAQGDDANVADFSGFREFMMDRRGIVAEGADTACVASWAYGRDDENILFVHVWETDEGGYRLSYAEFAASCHDPGCATGIQYFEVPIIERALTDSELANVRDFFSTVRVSDAPPSGGTCQACDRACCTCFVWDDVTFTDGCDPALHPGELQRIPFFLRQLRYGLIDDARERTTLATAVGTYHEEFEVDASNLTITPDGSFSWELDGCDVGGDASGSAVEEDDQLALYPSNEYTPFCDWSGCTDSDRVVVERIDADTIATLSGNYLITWLRGRICPICAPGYFGPSALEPCE